MNSQGKLLEIFSGHKYIEKKGSIILESLAKLDFFNHQEIDKIQSLMDSFFDLIDGHSSWEEEHIGPLLHKIEDNGLEFNDHLKIKDELKLIIGELKIANGKEIYLRFRKFYAELLLHLTEEELRIPKLLQQNFSDEEIKEIDYPIYRSMNSEDIINMFNELLPPCNQLERKMHFEDFERVNPLQLKKAWPKIEHLLW